MPDAEELRRIQWETPDRHTDWAWLESTYWYVPTPGLPAPQFDAGENTLTWMVDQTVWHVIGQRRGYLGRHIGAPS